MELSDHNASLSSSQIQVSAGSLHLLTATAQQGPSGKSRRCIVVGWWRYCGGRGESVGLRGMAGRRGGGNELSCVRAVTSPSAC